MDEVGPDRIEAVEVEPLQQRKLLQEDRSLAPRAALDHGMAPIIIGQGRFDRGLPAGHVVGGQEPAMVAPRGVEHLFGAAEAVDRLGDKAAIPGVAGAIDMALAIAATRLRLGKHAAVGRRQRRVAEQPPGNRRIAARQIDRGGTRPFPAK